MLALPCWDCAAKMDQLANHFGDSVNLDQLKADCGNIFSNPATLNKHEPSVPLKEVVQPPPLLAQALTEPLGYGPFWLSVRGLIGFLLSPHPQMLTPTSLPEADTGFVQLCGELGQGRWKQHGEGRTAHFGCSTGLFGLKQLHYQSLADLNGKTGFTTN